MICLHSYYYYVPQPLPQPDLLRPLRSLTHLTLGISDVTTNAITGRSGASDGADLPAVLRRCPSLRHLHVRLNGTLTSQLHGELGHHLCNITVSGPDADAISADALKVGARGTGGADGFG